MRFGKYLLIGLGTLLIGSKSLSVSAAELSINGLVSHVGVAAITNEVMDASEYISYAGSGISSAWGYEELGIAVVDGNLNVRTKPEQGAEIVGKMGNHAACEILETLDGWYHITSGEVEGYVSSDYIVTGIEAKLIGMQEAYNRAVITESGVRVRSEANDNAEIIAVMAEGSELSYIEETGNGWIKCELNADEVYVHADYVEIKNDLNTAVTIAQFKYGMDVDEVRVDLCEYALQFVGNPYVWGGTSLTKGADCSGYTLRIFENYGIELPHKAQSQSGYGTSISTDDVQPGDLLFYGSSTKNITHVAIYIGDGQIVHASDSKTGIIVSNAHYRTPVAACSLLD